MTAVSVPQHQALVVRYEIFIWTNLFHLSMQGLGLYCPSQPHVHPSEPGRKLLSHWWSHWALVKTITGKVQKRGSMEFRTPAKTCWTSAPVWHFIILNIYVYPYLFRKWIWVVWNWWKIRIQKLWVQISGATQQIQTKSGKTAWFLSATKVRQASELEEVLKTKTAKPCF